MVDTYGRWTEEKDYTDFPKEKMCDYDRMAIWIRNKEYEPKTSMENLIAMMFMHFDDELIKEDSEYRPDDYDKDYIDCCRLYVEDCGIVEFDYEF